MKQKYLYIIVAGIAVLIFAAIVASNIYSALYPRAAQDRSLIPPKAAPTATEPSLAASIEDIKDRPVPEAKTSKKEPVSMADVYAQYPAEDVGNNMVASWAKVRPEEKAKVIEQLDQQITQAQEALKTNPKDKNAKHVLFVSDTLKNMCKSNFDYSLLEQVPEDQGGLKKKGK